MIAAGVTLEPPSAGPLMAVVGDVVKAIRPAPVIRCDKPDRRNRCI